MDQLSCNNSRRRALRQVMQQRLPQLLHLHLVLPTEHPRPIPVLLHQSQCSEDTPLSQSAQRARKARNHEWCKTVSVLAARSPRSRSVHQTVLTRSQDVEVAPVPPPSLPARPRVSLPQQNSATNERRTKRKRSHLHHPRPHRPPATSQNPRNVGRPQRCSGLTASRSSSRITWSSNGCAIRRTPRRGIVSPTSRRISAPTNRKPNLRR